MALHNLDQTGTNARIHTNVTGMIIGALEQIFPTKDVRH